MLLLLFVYAFYSDRLFVYTIFGIFFCISTGHKQHEEHAAKKNEPQNTITLPNSPAGASPSTKDVDLVISTPPMGKKASIAQSMEEHGREKTMEMIMDEVLSYHDDSDDGTKPRTMPLHNDGVFEAFQHVDTFMNLNVYSTQRTPRGSEGVSEAFPETVKTHQVVPSTALSFKE